MDVVGVFLEGAKGRIDNEIQNDNQTPSTTLPPFLSHFLPSTTRPLLLPDMVTAETRYTSTGDWARDAEIGKAAIDQWRGRNKAVRIKEL